MEYVITADMAQRLVTLAAIQDSLLLFILVAIWVLIFHIRKILKLQQEWCKTQQQAKRTRERQLV